MRVGLTHVTTERLEAMLSALHKGKLTAPVTTLSLMGEGFHDLQDMLAPIAGLDAQALRAVLVCVLAERRRKV